MRTAGSGLPVFALLGTLALASCAGSLAEQAFMPDRVAARDDATCQSYGASPGSQRYQDCRLQLDANRTQENASRRALMATGAAIMAQSSTQAAPPPMQPMQPMPALTPSPLPTRCVTTGPYWARTTTCQ
jgi:hypothetical protein